MPKKIEHPQQTPQSPLQTCLAALRGIDGLKQRELLLGQILAALCQSGHLTGLIGTMEAAMTGIDHYNARIETRSGASGT